MHKMGTEVTTEEYKQVLLETMDYIDMFCRENNIAYFMIGGTLLGAVRHHGFIPWDDDIDIGMKREDYEKFCALFSNVTHKNIVLKDLNTQGYYLPYAKVCNKKINLYENINCSINLGAYIDIFPFDYIVIDSKRKQKIIEQSRLIDHLRWTKYSVTSKGKIRGILKKIFNLFYPYSLNDIARKQNKDRLKIASKYETEEIINMYGAWGMRELTRSEYFAYVEELEFEGRRYYAPIGYNNYLADVYGNYMQLPPIEKRVPHHNYVAYWSKDETQQL